MQELSKMQNIKIDWKWVFHTKTHHCVLINMNEKNFSSFWKQYYEDINKIEKFVILVPYVGVTLTPMEIARKYGLMLKDFFDSKKTTLIINEHVLNVLIKEETKSNFFKFLAKKNKNIIVFYEDDNIFEHISFAKENKSMRYNILKLNDVSLQKLINSKSYFEIIKTSMKNLHSPFKNPMESFKKIQES